MSHVEKLEPNAGGDMPDVLRWDTFVCEPGQIYTLKDAGVDAGFVVEGRDGWAQAFLYDGPGDKQSTAVSPVTDVESAKDALEGIYAARQLERGLV